MSRRRRLHPVWRDPGVATAERREQYNDTNQGSGYRAQLPADHPSYRERVAVPTMEAIDAMPQAYRLLVHEFGYVDIYRAWRRGLPVEIIRDRARHNNGVFVIGF